jgi:hypothetical protein
VAGVVAPVHAAHQGVVAVGVEKASGARLYFFAELQPTTSHDETIIKPRTRNADISILQFLWEAGNAKLSQL